MGHAHSARQPGARYFLTARLQDRGSDLLTTEIERLRAAMRITRLRHPFAIEAIVVLPATIHTIWTLPDNDPDFARRWSVLQSLFAVGLSAAEHRPAHPVNRGTHGLWQRRIQDHRLRDDADFRARRNFIHTAPVREGLVSRPEDWPYSSIHRDIALGRYKSPSHRRAAAPQARVARASLSD